ncbi:DNA-directed RNA polymerase subunit 6 [Catovirus CTV1]|uniref:DNA-directed RNA polymerase subunit 6 n=1 Tax=Catovirus CTV1 TaxID=1977631 RepID=A0A1V0SB76_9VIRU|nr:DNA-directed RNA polymerase subunit 6 [Catovirus CTV1]
MPPKNINKNNNDDILASMKDKIKNKINNKFSKKDHGTELDEDGNTDTDYNEELEDEYEDNEQSEDNEHSDVNEKEDDNLDDNPPDEDYNSPDEDNEADVAEDGPDDGPNDDVDGAADDEGCLYNLTKKKIKDYDSDEEFDEEVFDDDETVADQVSKFVQGNDRITGNVMTKYERVRILAERSKQLMLGAKPMLKNTDNIHPKDIARLELEMKVIPYKIHRERPDGKVEEWKINELKIVN